MEFVDLRVNPCLPGWFLVCVILGCFENFLDHPYNEPLPWFMIVIVLFSSTYMPSYIFCVYIILQSKERNGDDGT